MVVLHGQSSNISGYNVHDVSQFKTKAE